MNYINKQEFTFSISFMEKEKEVNKNYVIDIFMEFSTELDHTLEMEYIHEFKVACLVEEKKFQNAFLYAKKDTGKAYFCKAIDLLCNKSKVITLDIEMIDINYLAKYIFNDIAKVINNLFCHIKSIVIYNKNNLSEISYYEE